MKNLLNQVMLFAVLLSLSSCSIEPIEQESTIIDQSFETTNLTCVNSNPEARLINNGTVAFTFRIINNETGSEIIIGNVQPGSTTNWSSFAEGTMLFSIESPSDITTGVLDLKRLVFMANCTILDLEVDNNNNLVNSTPIDL